MAQTGYTPISIYYSSTASNTPTAGNLVAGELAINTADGKLFYKDSAGVVQVIAGKGGAGVAGGSNTQVQYNSSGSLAGSANMTFSGTALTLANDASISGLTVGKGGSAQGNNTAVGSSALVSNTANGGSSAVGFQAMYSNVGGWGNAFGYRALFSNTSGQSNTGIGTQALYLNTTGGANVAVGEAALYSNTTASNNTAVGYQAGYAITTGENNTSIGMQNLDQSAAVTGNFNIAIGNYSLRYITSGSSNVGVGAYSVNVTTTGNNNIGVGSAALGNNTTGSNNIGLGVQALAANTTASNNTAVGYQASYSNTTGNQIACFGKGAGYTNTTGTDNTLLGFHAGYTLNSGGNVAVGSDALSSCTSGSLNTAIGYSGGNAITTGSKNTILGRYTGNQGGLDIRTASNYIVLSDGDGNPRGVFDGSGTFFIGAFTSPSGTQRLVLTANGGAGTEPMLFNELRTGSATENYVRFWRNGSEVGTIQNTSVATLYNTTSDYRLKENVAPMTGALAKVQALKPCTYNWKLDGSNGQGFIAHELQSVIPECVAGEKDGVDKDGKPKYQGIDTSFLVATLTAAIQELKAEFDAYKATHP